ncbi:MAG: carbohydrate kinase family protein [Verrucomicrobia bacterium]|nr:carbohydrate kinase family protein [Verrucomicrobiota bacterium]
MPSTPEEIRRETLALLQSARPQSASAFIGLDGFVDEITRVVDQRSDALNFKPIATISGLAKRIAQAADKSTNVELVVERTKIGGNGPIMANALCQLGVRVTYVGALGLGKPHRVFDDLCSRAEVHSIADPGHSDALEFEDGKIILGKLQPLLDITWPNIQERWSRPEFVHHFSTSGLVGLLNWTMIPFMSDIWESLLTEVCPSMAGPRRQVFFDLADPQKRTHADIQRALGLIQRFESRFDVILGLNEKEAMAIGEVMGVPAKSSGREDLISMACLIQKKLGIKSLVVHPVRYAFVVTGGEVSLADGPGVTKPKITTGAGDHFNAGFCFGKLMGFSDASANLIGVSTSGLYVREARSPGIDDLIGLLQKWPAKP